MMVKNRSRLSLPVPGERNPVVEVEDPPLSKSLIPSFIIEELPEPETGEKTSSLILAVAEEVAVTSPAPPLLLL